MAETIRIPLNESQQEKIKKKLGRVCDAIEVDAEDLVNMIRYLSPGPQICIDFDEKQEQVVQKAFPGKECDFAIIDVDDLPNIMKYMPPPNVE